MRVVIALVHAILTILAGYVGMRLAMDVEFGGGPWQHPWFVDGAILVASGGTFAVVLELRRAREPDPDVADLRGGRLSRLVCALFGALIFTCFALRITDGIWLYDPGGGKGWFTLFTAVGCMGGASMVLFAFLNRRAKRRWFDAQGLTHRELPRAQLHRR